MACVVFRHHLVVDSARHVPVHIRRLRPALTLLPPGFGFRVSERDFFIDNLLVSEREFFIYNLLVSEREFFIYNLLVSERDFFIDNLLVRIHFIIVMIRWTGRVG